MTKLVITAIVVCIFMTFAFSLGTSQTIKYGTITSEEAKIRCTQFCENVGCNMLEYRYGGCTCTTPDGCYLRGDLEVAGERIYVVNINATSCQTD